MRRADSLFMARHVAGRLYSVGFEFGIRFSWLRLAMRICACAWNSFGLAYSKRGFWGVFRNCYVVACTSKGLIESVWCIAWVCTDGNLVQICGITQWRALHEMTLKLWHLVSSALHRYVEIFHWVGNTLATFIDSNGTFYYKFKEHRRVGAAGAILSVSGGQSALASAAETFPCRGTDTDADSPATGVMCFWSRADTQSKVSTRRLCKQNKFHSFTTTGRF